MEYVTLTPVEMTTGAMVGVMRQVSSVKAGRKPSYPSRNPWEAHILGALGEMVVAKHYNLYFVPSMNTFHSIPDLGSCQIRTRSNHAYDLLIRNSDEDTKNDPFILVTGIDCKFQVHGWAYGYEAMFPEFLKDHGDQGRPAYFYPQDRLRPMNVLPTNRALQATEE